MYPKPRKQGFARKEICDFYEAAACPCDVRAMRRSAALGLSVLFRWDAASRTAAAIVDLACCNVADTDASRSRALRASCGVGVRFWVSTRSGCCIGGGVDGASPAAAARPARATVDAVARADQRASSARHGRGLQQSRGRKRVLWRLLRGVTAACSARRRCRRRARRTHATARGAPTHSAVALSKPTAHAPVRPPGGGVWISTGGSGCWGRC